MKSTQNLEYNEEHREPRVHCRTHRTESTLKNTDYKKSTENWEHNVEHRELGEQRIH